MTAGTRRCSATALLPSFEPLGPVVIKLREGLRMAEDLKRKVQTARQTRLERPDCPDAIDQLRLVLLRCLPLTMVEPDTLPSILC